MALPSEPLVFGLYDCKVARMTDTVSETYNSWVDLPGIRKLSVKVNFDELQEVRGDNTTKAFIGGDVNSVDFSAENVALDIAALDEILAGVPSSSGSSTKKFTLKTTESSVYFKIAGKAKLDGGGTMIVTIPKAKLGNCSLELGDDSALFPSFSGKGVANSSNEVVSFQVWDSDQAIS